MKGRVLKKRCGSGRYRSVQRIRDLFVEALRQSRFANPRLADDQGHLAFTIQHAFPATYQQAQFILAPDEGSQSAGCRRFQPASDSAGLDHAV